MKLKLYKASEYSSAVRCSIQRSGKLGFTEAAIKKLDLDHSKSIAIAQNEEDPKDEHLYMVIYNEENPDAFKVNKAGEYFYLNTRNFFDYMEMDYKNKTIFFNLAEVNNSNDDGGNKIFKLTRKEITREKKDESDLEVE